MSLSDESITLDPIGERVSQLWHKGIKHIDKKEFDTAIRIAEEIGQFNFKLNAVFQSELMLAIARGQIDSGAIDGALKTASLIKFEPYKSAAFFDIAAKYFDEGNRDKAEKMVASIKHELIKARVTKELEKYRP